MQDWEADHAATVAEREAVREEVADVPEFAALMQAEDAYVSALVAVLALTHSAEEDLVEEVARHFGYEKIGDELPVR